MQHPLQHLMALPLQARLWAEMFVPNFTKRITILLSASDKEEVESANSEFSKGLVVSLTITGGADHYYEICSSLLHVCQASAHVHQC